MSKVYVLYNPLSGDKGGIEEQGTPAELMAKKGSYYRLYMAQFNA